MPERGVLLARYQAYNTICNRHAFDELSPYLADSILGNGTERTAQQYMDDLSAVHRAFRTTAGR